MDGESPEEQSTLQKDAIVPTLQKVSLEGESLWQEKQKATDRLCKQAGF